MTPSEAQSKVAVLALAVMIALVTTVPVQVATADPDGGASSATDLSSGKQTHHFGILGPVGQPGVYVTTHQDLRLSELVIAAGGITRDAASLARVIRQGRAGLQLVYSPTSTDTLRPGDVVIFERSATAMPTRPDELIGVAFIGITPDEPVVVSLPTALAALPQVLAALHQDPALINTVQVIRTSRTAPRIAAHQLPTRLVEGDIVVFQSSTIDHAALAQAQSFPPPVLIPERRQLARPEPVIQPGRLDGQDLSQTTLPMPLPEIPATAEEEPASLPEQAALPPLKFPEFPSSDAVDMAQQTAIPKPVAETPWKAAPQTDIAAAKSLPADDAPPAAAEVETTSLIPPPQTHADEPHEATSVTNDAATPAGSHSMLVPATRQIAFETPSQSRLAAQTPVDRQITEPTREIRLAEVPAPLEPATGATQNGFASRATLLGITVLMTAFVCFAASLLWSRLDDSTGLSIKPPPAEHVEQLPLHAQRSRPGTLDRLITNSLPMIEEPAVMPDQADFHGEAVGRTRLRIDAEHTLTGPHFAGASGRSPQPEAVPAQAETTRPDREDRPADSSGNDAAASSGQSKGQGGLLDRVLVAMEREKRR